MLGNFQQSKLRIELDADATAIANSLLRSEAIQKWLLFQRVNTGLPPELQPGVTFTTQIGPVAIQHQVDVVESNCLRLLLSQGIDGVHEWYWGDGWVQSCLEGVSLLPLSLGQTLSLLRLKAFLTAKNNP